MTDENLNIDVLKIVNYWIDTSEEDYLIEKIKNIRSWIKQML